MGVTPQLLVLAAVTALSWAASPRPHIVFIIADDLGWDDVGFHGSEINTPNIDALAYGGIILNQYYVSQMCTPTRSAILTGRHPIHTGLQVGVIGGATPYGLPLNETTMAQHLAPLGYRNHIVGKWHLGFFKEDYLPTKRGFESHFGYYTGHEDYFDHEAQDSGFYGLDLHRDGQTVWDQTSFSTDMYTDEAVNIIHQHNTSQPLFLYFAHQAVHAGNMPDPVQAPQRYVDPYANTIHDVRRRVFAGMASALDESVGRVVSALKARDILDNTIIVFTTDNGGPTNGYDGNAACNWPLRGVKNTLWEGGVRGVGFINSPLLGQSYVCDHLFHVTDWLPTLYRAAGGDPSTLPLQDGVDQLHMLSTKGQQVRGEVLHNIDPFNHNAALRVGDYKLVTGHISNNDNSWYPPPHLSLHMTTDNLKMASDQAGLQSRKASLKFASELNLGSVKKATPQWVRGEPIIVHCGEKPLNASFNCQPEKAPCLFHVPSDPCEFHNIAASNQALVQSLLQRLAQIKATMVPPNNKPVDPNGNPFKHGGVWKPWM